MTTLAYLIPVALFLGALGLGGFLWALKSGQYEDLDGAAERILIDREDKLGRQPSAGEITEPRPSRP
ncbi:cbb3-type cytochrome oxidase assembly protein CcoS [Mesorhizobium loti]|nr:cbb3-type cytochrome oxidase assembly protein CcoS [Mesorhizobium loti]